jgi:hypothetical protein
VQMFTNSVAPAFLLINDKQAHALFSNVMHGSVKIRGSFAEQEFRSSVYYDMIFRAISSACSRNLSGSSEGTFGVVP